MKRKLLISAVLATVFICFAVTGCADKKTSCDFEALTKVTSSGYDGYGNLKLNFDFKGLEDIIWDGTMAHDITITNFSDSVKYTYDKSENFKNGDKVDVEVSYNANIAETLGLKAEKTKFTVTVEGLEELKAVTFDDLFEVEFRDKGSWDVGGIIVDYKELGLVYSIQVICEEYPDKYEAGTIIVVPREYIQNGQTVTLRIVLSDSKKETSLENELGKKGYVLTSDSKQVTVSGLKE